MTVLTETFKLANGIEIPKIGFGTWQIPNGDAAYDSVAAALKAGYRHIDTAHAYRNEPSVGKAIADSGIARNEIFVTTKLPAEIKDYDEAKESFEQSLQALNMDYVDHYLIHAPWPWGEMGADYGKGNVEVWPVFEEALADGRAKSIGVSNFNVDDLEFLISNVSTKPHMNQIRFFIGNTAKDVVDFCQSNDILVEAYSPLATGSILENEDIQKIAAQYGKTVAQVSIRYCLQKGLLPLPKTTKASRMAENADVDFEISASDMKALDGLTDTDA